MEKSLSLYKLSNGQAVPFPSTSDQITVSAFTATYQRMGAAPSITATIMYPSCLDGQWQDVFVTFRDERFFVKNEPSSQKDSTDIRYSHSVVFESERRQLDEIYMIDAVQEDSDVDGYKSNDTKILFMGDIVQWAARLNDSLAYSGLYDPDTETGYHVVIDSGITSDDVLVSFEDKFISEALQEGFKAFNIPYYFVGKTIHFGYVETSISTPVEYGSDKALIRVGRENANIKLANRCSGYGSSDNIPYYYPNKTPLGNVSLDVSSAATISIRSLERLSSRIGNFPLSYGWKTFDVGDQVGEGSLSQSSGSTSVVFEDTFVLDSQRLVSIQISAGNDWSIWSRTGSDYNVAYYNPHLSGVTGIKVKNVATGVETTIGNGAVLTSGEYKVLATVSVALDHSLSQGDTPYFSATMHYACSTGVWLNNVGNTVDAYDMGLTVSGTPAIGDTVGLNVIHRMEAITRLMPPIFRSSDGAERFYNALNDTYPHPDGGYYEFENEYSDSDRRELIQEFPDIKPTITGMKNGSNQRIDMFRALAWDTNDNDEVDENGNYIHPYFFAKLAKTNGTNGFNLFDCATDSAMVVSFTSGVCGACKFEIGVDQDTKKNTVQVDASGNLLRDAYGDVRCGREGKPQEQFQDIQQDTSAAEVWIALKKDNSTYPVVMPSVVRNLKPTTSDTFVLLNIILPYAYITAAEERLKQAIIEYMASVNSPMFNPSVNFSRVFLEEDPDFLEDFNENALLPVKYNNKTESYYISTFTYTMSEGDILPEVSVDLIAKITAASNSLQTKLDAVKEDVLASVGTRDFMRQAVLYFLRKDIEDTAAERINFLKGVTFGRFNSGNLGSGGAVQIDQDGNSIAEVDYLQVRKKATFAELVVDKERAVEGELIITPAGIVITRVEPNTGYYRCYFQKTDNDGAIVFNPFVIGDLARCQTFNLTSNKYYWRKVVGVGQDYIDLSRVQGEYDGSDVPEAGDNVVQLGNTSDTDRQSAIAISSYGSNSPSLKMYHGINTFSLVGKDMFGVEYDPSTGYPKFYNYGAMRLGARAGEEGSFISYDNVSKAMNIKAIVNFLPQSTGLEQLEAYQKLVQIAQGNIETWFHDGVSPAQTGAPTMSNYPVNTWESEDYDSHVGDIYYSNTGKGYRFKKSGSTYAWEVISDSELAEAMAKVQALQYLKTATNEGTLIAGGLVLTSLLQLGYTDTSDIYHVMSGLNGIGSDQRGIAAWFGGPMVDHELSPSATDYAKSLLRFDGTGYLAKGNITWDTNGYGQVGGSGNNYAVKWDANGVTLGSGIKLGASDETLASLLSIIQKLGSMFTVAEYKTGKYALKVNTSAMDAGGVSRTIDGLYTEGFLSGNGASSENGGGGASLLRELLDVFGNSTSVLRADGTAAQNGDVFVYNTSKHKWLAVPQSSIVPSIDLSEYLKKTEAASTYQTIIDASHKLAASLISGLENVENKSASQILAGITENMVYAVLNAARKEALDSGVSSDLLDEIDEAIDDLKSRMHTAEIDIDGAQDNITSIQAELERVADIADKMDSLFDYDSSKNMVYVKNGGGDAGSPASRGLFAYGALSGNGASINSEGGGGGGGGDLPHVFLTEAEYEALGIKDPGTLYFTYEE